MLDGGRIVKMFMGVFLPTLSYDMLGQGICIALDVLLIGVGVCTVGISLGLTILPSFLTARL